MSSKAAKDKPDRLCLCTWLFSRTESILLCRIKLFRLLFSFHKIAPQRSYRQSSYKCLALSVIHKYPRSKEYWKGSLGLSMLMDLQDLCHHTSLEFLHSRTCYPLVLYNMIGRNLLGFLSHEVDPPMDKNLDFIAGFLLGSANSANLECIQYHSILRQKDRCRIGMLEYIR